MMLERVIPVSGEKIPVIGVGSWIQFDVDAHSPEKENLKEVLKLMHKKGARVIDSSPMYGRSEQVIGELTSSLPFGDEFFYATKVWTTGKENGIAQINRSLNNMNRKTMDLIQVHNMQDWQTHIDTLNEWKKDGKVRYTGVTHYRDSAHAALEKIVRTKAVDFVQFNYSIISRNAERTLLDACKDNGIAVLVNEPLEKGMLFKKMQGRKIPVWANELNVNSWAAFFLKYVLANEAVTCVIPGTSNPAHMQQILEAGEGPLPDQQMRERMRKFMDE